MTKTTLKLVVSKCTASSNGGYILKLSTPSAPITIGDKVGSIPGASYYTKYTEEVPVGAASTIEVGEGTAFTILERPFTPVDKDGVIGNVMMLNWIVTQ